MPWDPFIKPLEELLKYPVPATLVVLAVLVGFVIARFGYQGQIKSQKERIAGKDEVIAFKDMTIQSLNMQIEKLATAASDTRITEDKPNRRTTHDAMPPDLQPREALVSQKYIFVYNPSNGRNKIVEFLASGDIGEGRNSNEWMWRIRNSKLEFLNKQNEVYSRFRWNRETGSFHHTNEPDTKSLRGQFLVPAGSAEAVKLQNLQSLTGKDPPYF